MNININQVNVFVQYGKLKQEYVAHTEKDCNLTFICKNSILKWPEYNQIKTECLA